MKMQTLALWFVINALAPVAVAAADCSSIVDKNSRLACYDERARSAASTQTNTATKAGSAATQPGEREVYRSGPWQVIQTIDAMNDKRVCTAIYKTDWKIQGKTNRLLFDLRGRGGVQAYTVRIDDLPATPQQSATDTEKTISAISLHQQFQQIYEGARVRIQVLTLFGDIVNEDIDLNGFKDSVDYMRANCGR